MIAENSRSVANRDLPPLPVPEPGHAPDAETYAIVLFYQYKEPVWTDKEHKASLKQVIALGTEHKICGRGRVAPEGVNCTLSGTAQGIRDFCYALRVWNPLFNNTDFKITDHVPHSKVFKSLSVRKTVELVAYGLAGEHAPSLEKFAGTHLEADEYHTAMQDKDTVIIDVRNAYESAIGSFKPPEGGAELIDPKMRNSIEFPKWLNDPKTVEKINNKKVLMYCTGGIRCERASALLNEMSTVNPDLNPKGVYELRGGIERYVKTFPEGGFWSGKNYLFDRRMEQIPGSKANEQVEDNMEAKCCLCRCKWSVYRGQFKCCRSMCGVPVIVCQSCTSKATAQPQALTCELCKEGYHAPSEQAKPDLMNLKRKAEAILAATASDTCTSTSAKSNCIERSTAKKEGLGNGVSSHANASTRVFLCRLPLTVTGSKLRKALCKESDAVLATAAAEGRATAEAAAEAELAASKRKKRRANSFDSDSDDENDKKSTGTTSAATATSSAPAPKLVENSPLQHVQWLVDKKSGAFYGSAIVIFDSIDSACYAVYSTSTSNRNVGVVIDGKKIRATYAKTEGAEEFPPAGYTETEYPPVCC